MDLERIAGLAWAWSVRTHQGSSQAVLLGLQEGGFGEQRGCAGQGVGVPLGQS